MMSAAGQVEVTRQGQVTVVRMADPPSNVLSRAMRHSLRAAIEAAEADEACKAIVLGGVGASFSTGSDPTAPDTMADDEDLVALCARIEACSKPVVCALHGLTLEAGLGVALACHHRVMSAGAQIGAPDITIGMVAGCATTQRLPRLVGAAAALDLLFVGRPIDAATAKKIGLVDAVAKSRAGEAAIAAALALIAKGGAPRRTSEISTGLTDGAGYLKETAKRRAGAPIHQRETFVQIVECVEAALLMPFEAGVARETLARAQCRDSSKTKALKYALAAERMTLSPEGLDPSLAVVVDRVGIIGATPVALGITLAALDNGLQVRLAAADAERTRKIKAQVVDAYARAEERGQITPKVHAARIASFFAEPGLEDFNTAQVVIEATALPTDQRAQLLATIEKRIEDETVLATVTDGGFDTLIKGLAHPSRFVGLHFFAPVQALRALELVHHQNTSAEAFATAHEFARQLGKLPVVTAPSEGLVANRIERAVWAAMDVTLLLGARPLDVDRAMRALGFPIGPCAAVDMLGLSYVGGAVANYLAEAGRTGRAARAGFFDYSDDGDARLPGQDDDAAVALIAQLRESAEIPEHRLSQEDIQDRLLLAMANTGAQLLSEGVVDRPAEIDVAMLMAKAFPRWLGGPMEVADLMGLATAERKLRGFADMAPEIWTPAPLWRELIKNGAKFSDLNDI
ncbi:3-hydroxyacyl-CoA dehydrogenase NAD-binding domain-containing protein [Celeribacter arenosi]|uniref:3-hydroxyacyl-CoA dehydrogenase NAD-binding domain-containing protein n=1 Tax=Celeribacter arenosi TaxID=792649 RepID=A0ABP7KJT1_9RHOB